MIKVNPFTGQREFITPAVIKSISSQVKSNSNETPWQLATAEITYPNGKKQVVKATLFTATLKANPELFAVGKTVDIAILLDGEHAGKGKLQLPSLEVADVTALLTGVEKPNTIKTTKKEDFVENDESDFNYDSIKSEDQLANEYLDSPKEKGCITVLVIIISILITAFIFSGTIKHIGFLAYPLIIITGLALAKFTESLWLEK